MLNYEQKKYTKPNTVRSNTIQISDSNNELTFVQNSIAYYQETLRKAKNGVFPVAMVSLAGLGAVGGKEPLQKFGLAVLGGFFGNYIDKKRQSDLINDCKQNLTRLRRTRSQILQTNRQVSSMLANSKITWDANTYKPVINSSNYKNLEIPSIGLDKNSRWFYLFGDPSQDFVMMLHGKPGNGKSTFALQFADFFQSQKGKVLYVASEQHGTNKAFQDNLKRNTTSNFDILVDRSKQNTEYLKSNLSSYKLIVMDSVNSMKMSADDLEELRVAFPKTAFLIVLQSTKDSKFKGSQEWAHNSDIVIEMQNFKAVQTKSRFSAPATIPIDWE